MAAVPSPLTAPHPPAKPKPLYRTLYFQVLVAVAIGILLGHFYPQLGAEMKPLGDAFIKLVKHVLLFLHLRFSKFIPTRGAIPLMFVPAT